MSVRLVSADDGSSRAHVGSSSPDSTIGVIGERDHSDRLFSLASEWVNEKKSESDKGEQRSQDGTVIILHYLT